MMAPTISVIMPTYNHADFVVPAIESVLAQHGVDFEFLIADDGSTDGTCEAIASVRDERIHFFPNADNRGACVVTNELIDRSRGEFVALINSDDQWLAPDKLAYQLGVLRDDATIGAAFGRARFIDQGGREIPKATLPFGSVFDQPNRSRGKWLRHLFDHGNCFCHPTILIRRACYAALGGYDNRLRQLPDFDMWVRLLTRYEISVSERELVAFRYRPGCNASSDTAENMRRLMNESFFILRSYFDEVPPETLIDGFADLMVDNAPASEEALDIEKALLYTGKNRWAFHIYNVIGLEKVHRLLASPRHRELLHSRYGIDDRAFQRLAAEADAFDFGRSDGALGTVSGAALLAELRRRGGARWMGRLQARLREFVERVYRFR
jgi:hypothetical protein